jgi:hypothetical protein
MASHASRARTWVDRLYRGTAFLLLLSCVDILSPEVCAEELFGFPPAAIATAGAAAESRETESVSIGPIAGHSDGGAEPTHLDEDCFCCCSHLLVSAHFAFETEPPNPVLMKHGGLTLPLSPPHPPYRPPRVS